MKLSFNVYGIPAAQGSKHSRPIYKGKGANRVFTGKVATVESSKKVKPWRQDVKAAVCNACGGDRPALLFTDAVVVDAAFYFPRPKSHYGSGRNSERLKDSAPRAFCPKGVDLDKALRSTFDAITESGVWRDDVLVVEVRAKKLYADERPPGAEITIEGITP